MLWRLACSTAVHTALLLCTGLLAAEPDFPELPHSEVAPAPLPAPDAPQLLLKGQWYVIGSDKPLLILPSESGKVSVTYRKGPVVLPADIVVGRKADIFDKEFVTIPGPFVYCVRALSGATGTVTLQVIPAVNELDKDGKQVPLTVGKIVKRVLTLSFVPEPPPDPTPPKPPDPTPPVVAKKLYLAIIKNPRDLSPEQARLIGDTPFWDSLKADGHEWDVWANDSPRAKELGYIAAVDAEKVTLPALVIMDKEKGGRPLAVLPLPKDKASVVTGVKKWVR